MCWNVLLNNIYTKLFIFFQIFFSFLQILYSMRRNLICMFVKLIYYEWIWILRSWIIRRRLRVQNSVEENSPKVHQRFLKLHVSSILCILDFLEKDRILHLMKIHGVNFVEKFTETRSKKFQNCCNEFLKRKKRKEKIPESRKRKIEQFESNTRVIYLD